MKPFITKTKHREILLIASYVGLFFHLVIIWAYSTSQNSSSILHISYLEYLIESIPCVIAYILLALSNGRYVLAFLKTIIAIPFLFINFEFGNWLIFLIVAYSVLAFIDMYDYKIKLKNTWSKEDS